MTGLARQLGSPGIASLAAIAVTATFYLVAVKPLEQRSVRQGAKAASAPARMGELAGFYRYFDRPEKIDDWLAKLYGIATAKGLQLQQADYRLADSRYGIERYQITLPVSGSYAEVRGFLNTALAEIPVLSLDHASFRRKSASEPRIETELSMTLYVRRP